MQVVIILIFNIFMCVLAILLSKNHSIYIKAIARGYAFLWAFFLTLSSLNIMDFYSVSSYAYVLIFLSNFSFIFGICLFTKNRNMGSGRQNFAPLSTVKKKAQIVIGVVLLLSIVYLLVTALRYHRVVQQIGAYFARLDRFSVGKLFPTAIEVLFFNIVMGSLTMISLIRIAQAIVFKRIDWKFVLYCLIVLLYMYIGSGRLQILYLLCFLIAYFIIRVRYTTLTYLSAIRSYQRNSSITLISVGKTFYSLLFYFAIIAAICLSYFTYASIIRGGEVGNPILEAIRSFIVYNIGSIRAFDYGIGNIVPQTGFFYGRMTFSGIDEIIGYVVNLFGGEYNFASRLQSVYTQASIAVRPNSSFNALFTWGFWFYWDFGVIGVVLFPFVIGLLVGQFLKKFNEKDNSLPHQIIFCYIVYMLFFSSQKWVFLSIGDVALPIFTGIVIVAMNIRKQKQKKCLYQKKGV